jgi:hypothetical protein
MSTPNFNPDEYAKSMSAAAVEQMKNLKPGDIDKMIAELDNMGPLQKSALKAMNMDVSWTNRCFDRVAYALGMYICLKRPFLTYLLCWVTPFLSPR